MSAPLRSVIVKILERSNGRIEVDLGELLKEANGTLYFPHTNGRHYVLRATRNGGLQLCLEETSTAVVQG